MTADGVTMKSRIRSLLRSPSIKLRRSRAQHKENLGNKVVLEKVLGITAPGNRALACDPKSGLVAYPAGCVVVLLNPKKNKQHHIFNHSRKTITTLAFSPDGKYIVTGESGHMPAVRVWEVCECVQVVALQEHKYGVSCVAFSPNSKYIVSVGYHHDMIINVWNWKKDVVVASNKVSSKVTAVSFSDDSSYFVTAGNRHVKFWYLDHTKTSKVSSTVPLSGRSGLLGELRNNFFTDVACGRGKQAASTYCTTSSGLLCQFNERRLLDKWVELRRVDSVTTCQATCVCVTEELLFCGCADGTVRAFSPVSLHFLFTMPRPHHLGCDISSLRHASQLFASQPAVRYPDTVCVSYDVASRWLSCVYSDHSVYVWDVRDPQRPGKLYSALYHSACVWSLEVCPEGGGTGGGAGAGGGGGHLPLPPGSFLSCSADNTIRLWNTDGLSPRNILSQDLQTVIYTDPSLAGLTDTEGVAQGNQEKAGSGTECQTSETRMGLRTLCISPDGQHLASGDRMGILRIHDTESMEEILNVQAHDSEILCLEFSKPDTGLRLLATASRDRLIHVLDAARDYALLQTLDEHSSSITAVRFAANEGKVRMISCGADKSIYFRTAHKTEDGMEFSRTHHVVRKTTLYDMDIDSTRKYAAIGCQDRSIRIFNIKNGKQKKMYKGSQGEDGTLIKVQTDPSGLYIATSCSDKNISIFNFYSGECVATMYGHSEIVTGMKFTNDCKHLITVSGDSCIFVWRLSPDLTISMLQRLADLRPQNKTPKHNPRSEVHGPSPIVNMSSDSDKEEEEDEEALPSSGRQVEITVTHQEKASQKSPDSRKGGPRTPRRRWSRGGEAADRLLGVQSMLDLRHLDTYSDLDQNLDQDLDHIVGQEGELPGLDKPRPHTFKDRPLDARRGEELGSTVSLQVTSTWNEFEDSCLRTRERPGFIRLSPDVEDLVVSPSGWEDRASLGGSEFQVKEVLVGSKRGAPDEPSPDSACSLGYCPSPSPPTHSHKPSLDGWEHMEPLGMDGNSSDLEEEEEALVGGAGVRVKELAPQTPDQEAFLKQHFVTLADDTPSGSPSRSVQNSSENLSISSRFLCQGIQNPPPRRSVFPFSSETRGAGGAAGETGGGEKGSRVLVSEVRPLNQPSEGAGVKKPPVGAESRRMVGGVAKGVASYLSSSSGLRKAKSVQSLMPDTAEKPVSRPSREVAPLPQRPTTLPSSPRRPAASPLGSSPRPRPYPLAISPVANNNNNSNAKHSSPVSVSTAASSDAHAASAAVSIGAASSAPRRASRSYMSPTTSSMAKVSRSASLGDGLDTLTEDRPPGGGVCPLATPPSASAVPALICGPSAAASCFGIPGNRQAKLSVEFGHALPDKPSLAAFSPRTAPGSSSSSPLPLRTSQASRDPAPSSTSEPWTEGVVPTEELHHQAPWAPDQSSTSEPWTEEVGPTVELHHQAPLAPAPSSTSEPWKEGVSPTEELHHETIRAVAQSSTSEPCNEGVVPTVELHHQDTRVSEQSSTSESWTEGVVSTTELHHQAPLQSFTSEPCRKGEVHTVEPHHQAAQAATQSSTMEPCRERVVPTLELHVQPLETSQEGPGAADKRKDDDQSSVSLEGCRAAASELHQSFRRAAHLYTLVSSSSTPERREMNRVLSEAFGNLREELNSPLLGRLDPQCMLGGEDRALDLLERYSQLLLQAVEKKLEPH